MSERRPQCKDVPDQPILDALEAASVPLTWFPGAEHTLAEAFPPETPDRLILAKLRSLIRRGLITGCACGCRGDFRIARKDHTQ